MVVMIVIRVCVCVDDGNKQTGWTDGVCVGWFCWYVQMHAISAGFKVVATQIACDGIEVCRKAVRHLPPEEHPSTSRLLSPKLLR